VWLPIFAPDLRPCWAKFTPRQRELTMELESDDARKWQAYALQHWGEFPIEFYEERLA